MNIPWFIDITNQEGWEILLEQVECAALAPSTVENGPASEGTTTFR